NLSLNYELPNSRVRFVGARVVADATATGTQTHDRGATLTRLSLRGHGVPRARITLRSSGNTTRVTGTVAGRHVVLRVTSTH
ncbi:MAG: hypothetical protein ACJ780_15345, partial [Solirubrobacteraceae bacterium]